MAMVESINIDYVEVVSDDGEELPASITAIAEVELVRSRDVDVIDFALIAEALVIHVNAHGDNSDDYSGLLLHSDDEDTEYEITSGWLDWNPIVASALVIDACKSSTGRTRRQMRDAIAKPMAYVGTTRSIGWHDSAVWSSAFYGALLRRKGAGLDPADRVVEAAERANRAFKEITDRKSPFRCDLLIPSAKALKAFGE